MHPLQENKTYRIKMPLLDCNALLQFSKDSEVKVLAEAFVKHVLPLIDPYLQERFVEQIKATSKPELIIFSYKATHILTDPSAIPEDTFTGKKVSTICYEFCDKLPCGTPIRKALSGWASCELLGMVLGANIHVRKQFRSQDEEHLDWTGCTFDLIAEFQKNPVKRSSSGLQWWPEAFLNELISKKDSTREPPPLATGKEDDQVIWTRGTDGLMRSPGGGINLQDARTHWLWSTRDERDYQKCTFCGEMERECGGDHVDEMRYIEREVGGW